MGLQIRRKLSSLGPNFASTPQVRQAPRLPQFIARTKGFSDLQSNIDIGLITGTAERSADGRRILMHPRNALAAAQAAR